MKTITKTIVLLLCLLCAMSASAYSFSVNGIYYNVESSANKTVAVTYNNQNSGDYSGSVTIPSTVTSGNVTYTVVKIGYMAFAWCSGLTSVSIPNTVTDIASRAFANCYNITSITLPNSVETIGTNAFLQCYELKTVDLGSGLTSMADVVFYNCESLETVKCSAPTPPTIQGSSFDSNHYRNATLVVSRPLYKLRYLEDANWGQFGTINSTYTFDFYSSGFYYTYNSTSSSDKSVSVAPSVNGGNTYSGHVVVPSQVTHGSKTYDVTNIGYRAFVNCQNLTGITFNEGLVEIGVYSFWNCDALTSLKFPNTLLRIGGHAFDDCSALETVDIGERVSTIGDGAFMACAALESVTCRALLPPTIDFYTFRIDYSNFTTAKLYVTSNRAVNAYKNASYWENFTSVEALHGAYDFERLGIYYVLLDDSTNDVAITYMDDASWDPTYLESGYYLSGGFNYSGQNYFVREIGYTAFYGSTKLKRIYLPSTLRVIRAQAFSGCTKLTDIICLGTTPPTIISSAFDTSTRNNAHVYVPASVVNTYRSNAYWSTFTTSNIMPIFTEQTVQGSAGDIDGDDQVTISDVTALIDMLLSGSPSSNASSADVDGDGCVSISDVTALIDQLLSGESGGGGISMTNYTVVGVPFTMVHVDGGTFTMGATVEQADDAYSNEYPTHQVTLSPFQIGQTEVTQLLWETVMCNNPVEEYATEFLTGDEFPVSAITWSDAVFFLGRLSTLTGKSFKLPTEAQWEFAARGGNKSQGFKYAGSNTADDVANYTYNSAFPECVAAKAPNELGLYDMSGNVTEWCTDTYEPYTSDAQTDPMLIGDTSYRMTRGGSIYNAARSIRVTSRNYKASDVVNASIGMRLRLSE